MRMLSYIAACAALSVPVSSFAETAPKSFEFKGYTYSYETRELKSATLISGKQLPGGAQFSLVVRKDKVTGTFDGNPVSFKVAEAKGAMTTGSATLLSLR